MHPRTCDYASVCVLPVADALALFDAYRHLFICSFSRPKQKSSTGPPSRERELSYRPSRKKELSQVVVSLLRDGGPLQTSRSFRQTSHSFGKGKAQRCTFCAYKKRKQCVKVCTQTCAFSQTCFHSLWERSSGESRAGSARATRT